MCTSDKCIISQILQRKDYILFFIYCCRTTRTYFYEGLTTKDTEATELFHDGVKQSGHDSAVREIGAHPSHKNQMKPHQVEGFNFLLSNLVAENRGGCILAHAPLPSGGQTVGRSEKNTFPGIQASLIDCM